jgi:hypothetical protein
MLQQNWAIIESSSPKRDCIVYFIEDDSGVFDQLEFRNIAEAKRQLEANGFSRYDEDDEAKNIIVPPPPPFHKSRHTNGPICSSSRYWKTK